MRYLSLLLLALFFSGHALGGQCPALMKQVDSDLASIQLDAQTRTAVEKLRAKGESLHSEGKHAESEKALKQAMDMLESASEQDAEA